MSRTPASERPPAPVILIRGLPGVGKTTIAALLRDRLQPAVLISVDTIRYLAVPRDLTDLTVGRAELACAALARGYAEQGVTAIVEGVMADTEVLVTMVGQLSAAAVPAQVVTVTVGLEDLLRRNAGRDEYTRMPEERIRWLYERFDAHAGHRLPTDGLVAEETADNLQQFMLRPTPRSPGPTSAFFFMRHGAAAVQPDRYPNQAVMGLSEQGRAQVLAARAYLARLEPEAIVSSPLPRAVQTAELIDAHLGLGIEIEPRLAERTIPAFYGWRYDDIRREIGPDAAASLQANSDEIEHGSAESLTEAAARVISAIDELGERPERKILIVSHGGPHGWALARQFGLSPQAGRLFELGPARLSCFQPQKAGAEHKIHAINVSAADLAAAWMSWE
jgi:broad specificity phosphatase PhoE/chloramphenicol 3-O-phosphotransferase